MNLSKEIISSWKLQGDKLLSEELLLSYGFSKYAHIVFENFPGLPDGTSYDVYRLVIAERDNQYMEVRYAFFDGFIGLYIIDKETRCRHQAGLYKSHHPRHANRWYQRLLGNRKR